MLWEGNFTSTWTLWSSFALITHETSPENLDYSKLQSLCLHWQYHSSLLDIMDEAASISRPLKQTEWEKFNKPADVGFCGISPGEIIDHNLWCNGPSLLKDPSNWHSKICLPLSLKKTLYSSDIDEPNLKLKEWKKLHFTQPLLLIKPNLWMALKDTQTTCFFWDLLPGYFVLLPYIVPHLFEWLNCLKPKLGCLNKHKLRLKITTFSG